MLFSRGIGMTADQVSGFFGNHDGRSVGVAGSDTGHDGGVDDAESFDAVDAELGVDDRGGVVAHFAGAGRMVESLRFGADESRDFGIGARLRTGMELRAAVEGEGVRMGNGAREFDAFDDDAKIFGSAKIIGADGRRREWIGGPENDFAATLRRDERGAETEGVFGMGSEAVVAVVGGAEKDLEIRDEKMRSGAMEEAGFGDIGSERAAMRNEVANQIGE